MCNYSFTYGELLPLSSLLSRASWGCSTKNNNFKKTKNKLENKTPMTKKFSPFFQPRLVLGFSSFTKAPNNVDKQWVRLLSSRGPWERFARLVGDSSRESMTRAMIIASRHRFPRANPTRQRSPQALPLSLSQNFAEMRVELWLTREDRCARCVGRNECAHVCFAR